MTKRIILTIEATKDHGISSLTTNLEGGLGTAESLGYLDMAKAQMLDSITRHNPEEVEK